MSCVATAHTTPDPATMASAKVWGIAELVNNIMDKSDPYDVLRCMRVNSFVKNAIHGNPATRRSIWFDARHRGRVLWIIDQDCMTIQQVPYCTDPQTEYNAWPLGTMMIRGKSKIAIEPVLANPLLFTTDSELCESQHGSRSSQADELGTEHLVTALDMRQHFVRSILDFPLYGPRNSVMGNARLIPEDNPRSTPTHWAWYDTGSSRCKMQLFEPPQPEIEYIIGKDKHVQRTTLAIDGFAAWEDVVMSCRRTAGALHSRILGGNSGMESPDLGRQECREVLDRGLICDGEMGDIMRDTYGRASITLRGKTIVPHKVYGYLSTMLDSGDAISYDAVPTS